MNSELLSGLLLCESLHLVLKFIGFLEKLQTESETSFYFAYQTNASSMIHKKHLTINT